MAKCKRIVSALLSVVMVLTVMPLSIATTAAAKDVEDNIQTSAASGARSLSATGADGKLDVPVVTLESTSVIRVADASNPFAIGTTVVAATPSGLPQISGDYTAAYYCDETPALPTVAFTVDRDINGTPTIACENNTGISFSDPAVAKNSVDGTTTYTWTITAGTNVPVGALRFVVGYSYSYVDALTNKTITKNYNAYATSYVENVAQPGGFYVYRERSNTTHSNEICNGVARILGANTYGSFYTVDDAAATTTGWAKGYYNFLSSGKSFVTISDTISGAMGYGMVSYTPSNDSTGNVT
ncbi:MAG: hypothetical protein PUB20_02165, partial [Clostridia bacterium]|nr:hypothetical protein [Clostridia bacterium]